MMMRPLTLGLLLLLGSSGLVVLAAVGDNVVRDGCFSDPYTTLPYKTFNASENIGCWTVTAGQADIVGSFWQQAPSSQCGCGLSIDLNGLKPGTVSQTLTTTPGNYYSLSMLLSGNWYTGSDTTKTFGLYWCGTLVETVVVPKPAGWARSNMLWARRTWDPSSRLSQLRAHLHVPQFVRPRRVSTF